MSHPIHRHSNRTGPARSRRLPVTLALLILLFGIGTAGTASAWGFFQSGEPLDPGSFRAAIYGGYNNNAGEWWNWATGIYPDTPILDETGALCAQGQHGRVWYLAGNFGGTSVRDCTVPRRKALFFPIFNTLWWFPEDGTTVEELREIANSVAQTPGIFNVEVDGVPIGDLNAYRAQSPPDGYTYRIDPGSFANTGFGFPPGDREPAVADGFWMMLSPMSAGAHTVRIQAEIPDFGFELDVTYNLIVQ